MKKSEEYQKFKERALKLTPQNYSESETDNENPAYLCIAV